MRIVAACEDTGALKLISAPHGTDTSKPIDEANPKTAKISTHAVESHSRKSKVIHLTKNASTGHVVVARLDGSVEVYDILPETEDKSEGKEKEDTQKDQEDDENTTTDLLPLLYQSKAVIPQYSKPGDEIFIYLTIDDSNRILAATNKGSVFVWSSEDSLTSEPTKFTLPLNDNEVVEAFGVHPGKKFVDYVAYGGKETDLRVVKLPALKSNKKPEVVFKAKNVSDSKLDLRVPIHIKSLVFAEESTPENFKIHTFTAVGDMRIYESAAGRKPRSSKMVLPKKAPITEAIWISNELVLTDNRGTVIKIDPKSGSQLSQFKGNIGSVQALMNFENSILATTGVDRYVRAYNNQTRECIVKVFIGAQSNAICIIEDAETLKKKRRNFNLATDQIDKPEKKQDQAKEDEEISDEEELWNKLELNNEVTQRRKRRKLALSK